MIIIIIMFKSLPIINGLYNNQIDWFKTDRTGAIIIPLELLPAAVQDLSSSSSCFCSYLKTELFSRAYGINSP